MVSIFMKNGIFAVRAAVLPAALACSFIFTTGYALADDSALALPQVMVTATRVEQPLADVLSSVSVITRADIERSQAQSLADLLQGEAGFEFARNGGPGAVTSFFLRGQNSINSVIVVDGVRSSVDQIGSLLVIDIPLHQIERIEILRGNASALYGDAAVGGVISITTVTGKGKPRAYGSVGLGSANTRQVQAGYAGEFEGVRLNLNLGQSSSDGFSAIDSTDKRKANPDKDGYSSDFFALNLDRKLDVDTALGLRYKFSSSNDDYDISARSDALNVERVLTDKSKLKRDTQNLGVFVKHAWTPNWSSTLDFAVSQMRYEDSLNGVLYTSGDGSWKNGVSTGTQRELRWSNTVQALPATLLHFGVDYAQSSYTGEGDNAYEMRKSGLGSYLGVTQSVQALTLQANVRNDKLTTEEPSAGDAAKNEQNINSSLLGVGYKLGGGWKVNGTMSTGFRAPTAYEVAATPGLKSETYQSREVGVVYAQGVSYARAAYFESHTDDAIDTEDYVTYANVGRTENKGLEAALRTQIWGNALALTMVSQDPKNRETGKRLARRARTYGTLSASRVIAGVEWGAKVYAADERKDSDYSDTVLPGYAIASFYASKEIEPGWMLRGRIENAFDRKYELASGYNTPGAGVFVTLQYQPK
jgi:vitamin B12 transporter